MYANKVNFQFLALGFDAATAASAYTTPGAFSHRLGVLQAIQYKRADFRAVNESDAVVTVNLRQGGTTVASLNLAANASGALAVDLAGISGAAALGIEVVVNTVGTGTGNVQAVLDVEQPVIVGSC